MGGGGEPGEPAAAEVGPEPCAADVPHAPWTAPSAVTPAAVVHLDEEGEEGGEFDGVEEEGDVRCVDAAEGEVRERWDACAFGACVEDAGLGALEGEYRVLQLDALEHGRTRQRVEVLAEPESDTLRGVVTRVADEVEAP